MLSACGSALDVLSERADIADRVARTAGLTKFYVPAGRFELVGYRRFAGSPGGNLTVYIEGDGLAYLQENVVSRDPTPRDPVSLRLAARDPEANVAYLARPCQYQTRAYLSRCDYAYWTTSRFAPEVVASTDSAIDALKKASGAARVRLVGYSGGGVLAALITARRVDVASLVTVASPLDHATWTRLGGYSPLSGSLDPMRSATATAGVPQRHFVGEDDELVPIAAIRPFVERVRASGGDARLTVVPDEDHWCCWDRRWPGLVDGGITGS